MASPASRAKAAQPQQESCGQARGSSRLSQLVAWCGGPAFDGCLLFDECHKAKNWTGKEETSSKVAAAVRELQRARATAFRWLIARFLVSQVRELQRALPLARVVYCSATGASDSSLSPACTTTCLCSVCAALFSRRERHVQPATASFLTPNRLL